jgi:uncharacterized protein (UPF0548 family)
MVRNFIQRQATLDFSYQAVGATAKTPPPGYRLDHTRARLGQGAAVYRRAEAALRRWDQFRIGWAEVQPPGAPIVPGEVVAILARRVGLWWLNACRIIYVVNDPPPVRRFGFAYGTLPDHAGTGEERFLVEWNEASDEVWYDILAFSRPHRLLSHIGYPYMRLSQRKFGRESAAAMRRAVADPSPDSTAPLETIR